MKVASPMGPNTGMVAEAPNLLNWRSMSAGIESAPDIHTRHRGEVVANGPGIEEHPVHGGNADEPSRTALLDGLQHLTGLEPFEHVDRQPGEGQAQIADEPHDVSDRQTGHDLVAADGGGPQRRCPHLPHQRPMGQCRALGFPSVVPEV